jgi:hypothetical protein
VNCAMDRTAQAEGPTHGWPVGCPNVCRVKEGESSGHKKGRTLGSCLFWIKPKNRSAARRFAGDEAEAD